MSLREKFFDALRNTQRKQLVAKSASAPPLAPVRNSSGEIIGYGEVETPTADELARVSKVPVCKSADGGDSNGLGGGLGNAKPDPNAVMDSVFFGGVQTIGVSTEVAKSATQALSDADLEQRAYERSKPWWVK